MDIVFKFFDQMTGKIPPRILQMVRLGALLVWLIAAVVVCFYAFQRGAMEAPQSGQDLSMATIREKIIRAENLNKPPDITIPELNDLAPENQLDDLPYERRSQAGQGLAAEDDSLREPTSAMDGRQDGAMPPYLSDTQSPSTDQVFPRNSYKPARDPGAAGVRERPSPGQEIPVFELDGSRATPPTRQPLRRPEPTMKKEGASSEDRGAAATTIPPREPTTRVPATNAPTPRARPTTPAASARPVAPPRNPPAAAPGGSSSGSSAGGGLDLLPVD